MNATWQVLVVVLSFLGGCFGTDCKLPAQIMLTGSAY